MKTNLLNFTCLSPGSEYFAALVAGQLVTTFSSLMFVSVTFFSEVWFSPTERALSTAVSAVVGPKVRITQGETVNGEGGGGEEGGRREGERDGREREERV